MNKYERAIIRLRDRRREELDGAQIAWQEALRADDALYAAYVKYHEEMLKSAKGETNTLDAAERTLRARMAALGLDEQTFSPPPHCALCGDSGLVDGNYCSCVIKSIIQADAANMALPQVNFFRAESTAPAAIKKVYSPARDFIAGFPGGNKPFFSLLGSPGTGKTYLAAAIATSFMEKGAAVVAISAFDFVRRALDYHKQFTLENYVDRFTPTIDCDLLVIDDLGKENMLKNVTLEYLCAVIDERYKKAKHTLITSNLSPSAVLDRYGEALTSRLFDKSRSYNFVISGKNARFS